MDDLSLGPSFTVPADASKASLQLPPGVWREVLEHLSVQERFVACMVCKAWRGHALSLLTPDLEVCLHSGAAADGFKAWLAAHASKLHSLTLTEHFFDHHGTPMGPPAAAAGAGMRSRLGQVARLKLWQGLHAGGQTLQHLHTLKVQLDDVSDRDACCLGLCLLPSLTHLTLESNASAIGVTGAAGLVPLTSLQELVLPSQALGDQGLQYICGALSHLQALNVHNDGHVTDDGLGALSGLSGLTSLDLQGNVSITQAAMPTLAAAAPRLAKLNLAWLAMVGDWGLGQLSSLTRLQDLDLRATGVQLKSPPALAALASWGPSLTHLNLARCRVDPPALQALATSLPGLQALGLASCGLSRSCTELLPLQQLSRLSRLDLSSNLLGPGAELALCCMSGLRHLALNNVVRDRGMGELLQGWLRAPQPHPAAADSVIDMSQDELVQAVDDVISRELLLAAAPVAAGLNLAAATSVTLPPSATPAAAAAAAAGGGTSSRSSGEQPCPAAAAAVHRGGVETPWGKFLTALPRLQHLTALEFADNGAGWCLNRTADALPLTRPPDLADTLTMKPRALEPALLLLGFAAAGHTALQSLHLIDSEHHAGVIRERRQVAGEVHGTWNKALTAIAAVLLEALGDSSNPDLNPDPNPGAPATGSSPRTHGKEGAPCSAARGGGPSSEVQLEQLVGSMRVEGAGKGSAAAAAAGAIASLGQQQQPSVAAAAVPSAQGPAAAGSSSSSTPGSAAQQAEQGVPAPLGSSRVLSAAAQRRLQALVSKVQAAQQQRHGEDEELRLKGLRPLPGHLVLSRGEAIEVLQLLLPGLHSLYCGW